MKRLITFLALCCLMVTGVWADGFIASTVASPKAYILTNANNMTIASNLTYHGTEGSGNAAKGMFAFISTGETNKYKIYESEQKKFVGLKSGYSKACKNGTELVEESQAEVFTIEASNTTGQYLISPTTITDKTYLNFYQGGNANKSGETIGFYTTGNGDAGSRWAFEEALPVKTVASASDLSSNNTWYQLMVRYKYVKYDANSQTYYDTYDARPEETDETSLFAFVGNQTDGYKIVNKAAGNSKAMGADNANTDTRLKSVDLANARTFLFKKVSSSNAGTWQIYDKNDNAAYLNQQGTNLGYWKGGGNGDDGNRFTFTEVVFGAEKVDVTYVFTNAYNETVNVVVKTSVGATATAPSVSYFSNATITEENKVVGTDNTTFHVNGTWNFPFQEGKDYTMHSKANENNYVFDGTNAWYNNSVAVADHNNLWQFQHVAGTLDLYMLKTYSGKYAVLSGSGRNALTFADSPTEWTSGTGATSYFRVVAQNGGFNLQHPGDVQTNVGSHVDNKVGSWQNANSPTNNASINVVAEAVEQTYTLGADGKPDCVTVKIEGNVVDGEWPQGFDYVASKQLSNADIEVTTDDGYVATYTVDNTHHQVNFSFDRIFEPIEHNASIADGTKKYFIKNPAGYYIDYIDPNLPGTQVRKDAAKFVFEKSAEAGKYYIYCVDAQKYLKYTGTGNGGNKTSQADSKVQLVDAKGDNCLWVFDNQVCIIPAAGGGAGLNFTGGANEGFVLNLYSTGDDKSKWQIVDSKLGSLACATLVFSKPGEEFIHKLIPEEGVTIESVDFDTDLNGALTLKERPNYKYVSGTAPMQEKDYIYNVNLSDGTTAKVTLRVESFLQSPTPFMGWLSWNWFGQGINETNMKAIGQGLKDKGLIDAGYTTLVLDDTWAANTGSKDNLIWHATKFPNPTQFISDIKALGLKLGIYSDAGSSTCTGQQPGSYGYETQHMALFKEWGIDFLKYDRCNAQGGLEQAYSAMGRAIAAVNAERKQAGSTTPFVFNACEWGRGKPWTWGAEAGASSWRSTEDGREEWCGTHGRPGVLYCSDETREYWMYTGVNRYNDLDMMCIGLHGYGGPSNNTSTHGSDGGKLPNPLTTEQARSQMSIWCMFASPLSITCDVRETPSPDGNKSVTLPEKLITDDDLAILKNKDIISINQDALGQQAEYMKNLSHDDEKGTANAGGYSVYLKDLKGGKMALAIVNRSATATLEAKTIAFDQIYLSSTANYYVKDVWAGSVQQQTGNLVTDAFDASETKVYIISEEPFEEEVEPAFNIETESTVTSSQLLNGLTVTFTGANAANVQLSSTNNKAYLVKNETPAEAKAQNGKFYAPRLKAAEEMPEDAIEGTITKDTEVEGQFNINFGDATIEAGDYTVTIPEGTFYVGTEEHPVPLLTANYEVLPTFITSLDQLDNGTAYTITSFDRGQWTAVNDKNYIYQTAGTAAGKTWNTEKDGYTPISANSTEANQQWAILKSDKGNYYLYNVGQQKFFVSKDNYSTAKAKAELAAEPNTSDFQLQDKASVLTGTALSNYNSSNQAVRFTLSMSGNFFGVTDWDGEQWKVFQNNTDYNSNQDAGMYFKIVPVASFDATAAMAKIEAFEGETVVPATGYYYIKESGQYLYNDFLSHSEATQSATTKQAYDNGYVWHVTSTEGSTTVTLLNGEGSGYNSTTPNSIDLSSKNWTFEAYSGAAIPVTVEYAILGEYLPFADGYLTYKTNNNMHHGGFITEYPGTVMFEPNFVPNENVFGHEAPDGTTWTGTRKFLPEMLDGSVPVHVYYYTAKDEERNDDLYEKVMAALFTDFDKPGYPAYYELDFENLTEPQEILMTYLTTGEVYEYKYVLGVFSEYVKGLEVIQPQIGEAFHVAIRGNHFAGTTKYYLKNDGSYTVNEAEADVFVLGNTGDSECGSLFVSNNNVDNGGTHYLQREGALNKTYSEDDNALKLGSMVTAENNDIEQAAAYRYGTFTLADKDGKVMTFNESGEGSWNTSAGHPYMDGQNTSAIELIPVEYPFNKVSMTAGNDGVKYTGKFASIYLPYPMCVQDGVDVYEGIEEKTCHVAKDIYGNDLNKDITFLTLKKVEKVEGDVIPAGGYILYSEQDTPDFTVYPAASDIQVPSDSKNVFVGSTEYPAKLDADMYNAKMKNQNPYVLAKKNDIIGFYKYLPAAGKEAYPKGKAIWMAPVEQSGDVIRLGFGDIITAIEALHGHTEGVEIFDLQGRRLDKVEKGKINVINGQKIMFK